MLKVKIDYRRCEYKAVPGLHGTAWHSWDCKTVPGLHGSVWHGWDCKAMPGLHPERLS